MTNKEKGVIANESYAETDDYITRTYVMPLLFDDESRRKLISEHRNSPVGTAPSNGRAAIEHSHDLEKFLINYEERQWLANMLLFVFVCLKNIR